MFLGNLKIKIGFHAAAVHMCRHGIPHASRLQLRHSHLQLTSRQHLTYQHLVNATMVRAFQRARFGNDGICLGNLFIGIITMCGSGIEIKLGGQAGIFAFKSHFTVSRSQIKSFLIIQFKHGITGSYHTGTSHIEYTHFATGQKIRSFQRLDGFELQYFTYGPGSPYHHTVVHRIHYINLIVRKNLFYQKVAAYPCSIIMLGIFGMSGIANFIICFHTLFICV